MATLPSKLSPTPPLDGYIAFRAAKNKNGPVDYMSETVFVLINELIFQEAFKPFSNDRITVVSPIEDGYSCDEANNQ